MSHFRGKPTHWTGSERTGVWFPVLVRHRRCCCHCLLLHRHKRSLTKVLYIKGFYLLFKLLAVTWVTLTKMLRGEITAVISRRMRQSYSQKMCVPSTKNLVSRTLLKYLHYYL